MDRASSIKFKLMPDGQIRGHDLRKGTGASEAHILLPFSTSDTITTAQPHKLLITNEAILKSLMRSVKRKG